MSKKALIVVDIQNDYFADGKWPLHNMEASAAKAAQVLQHARNAGDLIIHVRHESEADASFFLPDSEGAEIHDSVAPLEGEPVVVKHHINSFLQTNLKELLDQHNVEKLTLAGSMSHMCIDAATRAAADYNYAVTVIEDACASHNMDFNGRVVAAEDVHAAYMFALGFAYAEIKTAAEYLA